MLFVPCGTNAVMLNGGQKSIAHPNIYCIGRYHPTIMITRCAGLVELIFLATLVTLLFFNQPGRVGRLFCPPFQHQKAGSM